MGRVRFPIWLPRSAARLAHESGPCASAPERSTSAPANNSADDQGETLLKLIEVLDDHDDVQNVYGNYELSDALMAKLAG